ncbi:hypothetical protein [Hymenobacter defluvii]|uniref:Phage tail tape measure protein n=1 Tax=Hymenobacter defluvii TaxID=2054411 RepID=A0ABS3THU1_9BACT|nr:hypothetical protein [Hymenobacter defluvii]MBO3273217.1 hypothetical protein [Hymenobacter defluvii]
MAAEISLDLTGPIRELNQAAIAARKLSDELQKTADAGKGAFQAAAEAQLANRTRLLEHNEQLRAAQQLLKDLTAQLKAQEQAERELAIQRNKPDAIANARRLEDLKRIREEIQRLTQALAAQGVAAKAVAAIPPLVAPSSTPTSTGVGNVDELAATQQQARDAVQATTDALQQQTQQADSAATQYQALGQAVSQTATALAESIDREKQARQSRTEDVAQLKQLQAAEKDLKAQRDATAPGVAKNDLQLEINANRTAQRALKADIEAGTKAIEREKEAQKALTLEAKQTAAAEKQAAQAAKEAAKAAQQTGGALGGAAEKTSVLGRAAGLLEGVFNKAARAAAALFIIDKAKEFGAAVLEASINAQKLEARLTNAFNGNVGQAKQAALSIQSFAQDYGADAEKLAETYARLINRGIKPTREQLVQLSDIAATSGKSIDQFVEALLDAQTGQNERLKEFGINAKASGDKVAFTFRGITTEVEKTDQAISAYLFGLGNLNGIQGATAAQAEKTGGAIAGLKADFNELFVVIGEKGTPAFNKFLSDARRLTKGITDVFKSEERLAAERAATTADTYAKVYAGQFTRAIQEAKRSGSDVTAAVGKIYEEEALRLNSRLEAANKRLGFFNTRTIQGNVNRENYQGGDDAFYAERQRLKDEVAGNQANLRALKEQYQVRLQSGAAEANTLGLIEKQKKLIDSLRERQLSAAQESQGNGKDYLLGKGGLNEQLKIAEKELDRLYGKVDKANAKALKDLQAALEALRRQEQALLDAADNARINGLQDDGSAQRVYSDAVLRKDLQAVDRVEQELLKAKREAQQPVVLNTAERGGLDTLRNEAVRKNFARLRAIEQAEQDKLFDLRRDSDAKELEALERRFQAEQEKYRGNVLILQGLQEQYDRDRQELLNTQAGQQLDAQEALANAVVESAALEFTDPVKAERVRQQGLLDVKLEFAKKRLALAEKVDAAESTDTTKRVVQELKNTIAELSKTKPFDLAALLGIKPEDRDKFEKALESFTGFAIAQVRSLVQTQVEAAQTAVDARTQQINETQTALNQEIALNKTGSASSVALLREQLKEEKEERRKALQDRKQAQRLQLALDTATQASSLITAVSDTYKGFATIPIIGPGLGIAAGLVLIASFIAAKSSALQAINKSDKGFFKGGYTGGASIYEERGPVHGQEFVIDNRHTKQHRNFLEALHKDELHTLSWQDPTLLQIKSKVQLDPELPTRLLQQRAAQVQLHYNMSNKVLEEKLEQTNRKLDEAIQQLKFMPKETVRVELPNSTTVVKNYQHNLTTFTHRE